VCMCEIWFPVASTNLFISVNYSVSIFYSVSCKSNFQQGNHKEIIYLGTGLEN
jgi:hypothetical protein